MWVLQTLIYLKTNSDSFIWPKSSYFFFYFYKATLKLDFRQNFNLLIPSFLNTFYPISRTKPEYITTSNTRMPNQYTEPKGFPYQHTQWAEDLRSIDLNEWSKLLERDEKIVNFFYNRRKIPRRQFFDKFKSIIVYFLI